MPETDFEQATASIKKTLGYLERHPEVFTGPKGEDLNDGQPVSRDDKLTNPQLFDLVSNVLGDLAQVCMDLLKALHGHEDEIRRLKNHRHDAARSYTGKPEL